MTYFFLLSKEKLIKFFKSNSSAFITLGICLAIAIIYVLLRATVFNFLNSFNFYQDDSLYATSVLVRLATFTKVVFVYWRLLFFPYPLHMERTVELVASFISLWPALLLTVVSVLSALGWHEYKRKKTAYIWFGLTWFFGMLVTVSGIIPINGILYEHWLYLPMVGFFICIVGLLKLLPEKLKKILRKYSLAIGSFIAIFFIVLTIRQNYIWQNQIRFYEYLLQFTSASRVYNNLGIAYAEDGQFEKAIENYEKSMDKGENLATYHNMGNVYRALGDFDQAIVYYSKAIELNPLFTHPYNPLIQLYIDAKEYEQALKIIALAQHNFPNDPNYLLIELQISKITENREAQEVVFQRINEKFGGTPEVIQTAQRIIHLQ